MKRTFFRCLPFVYKAVILGLLVSVFVMSPPPWHLAEDHHPRATTIMICTALVMMFFIGKVDWWCSLAAMSPEERRIAKNLDPFLKRIFHLW